MRLYKYLPKQEVNTTMTLNSKYTKHALEELHENISVIRHPGKCTSQCLIHSKVHSKCLTHFVHVPLQIIPAVKLVGTKFHSFCSRF